MFKQALDALATLSVPGVMTHYALESIPDQVHRGQMPLLLVLPIEPEGDSGGLFAERGGGFESLAFANGGGTVTYQLTHLLLVAPDSAGQGVRSHLPALIDLIDAYFTALSADVTLGGRLAQAAQVRVDPGIHSYGGVDYIGCAFRHTWVLRL